MAQNKCALQTGQKFLEWTVVDKLGAGAFGEVYRVRDNKDNVYALKTEHCNAEHNVLMMDVTVLQDASRQRFRHFAAIIDSGRYRNDFYLIMSLLGKSLHDLRKARREEHFSMGTAIGAAIQTLEAIEELHTIGYLHRDVKPGNYSIGHQDKGDVRTVYILDFGMCRRYVREDNTLRRPRSAAGFRGTPRYAALRCHMNMEYCRADDVESWLYMLVELTTAGIPWRRVQNMSELGDWKRRVHAMDAALIKDLFRGCPPEYKRILESVIALGYYDAPDYAQIYKLLRQALSTMNVNEHPYDWEQQQQQKAGRVKSRR